MSGDIAYRQMLVHRHELHILRAGGSKETVDLRAPPLPGLADGSEGIELHPPAVQDFQSVHHLPECTSPRNGPAVTVMNVLRAVEGKAEQKVIVMEKCRPLPVEQGAVGLERIVDRTAAGIFPLKRQCAPEKVHTGKQRLASVPFDRELREVAGGAEIPDAEFQQFQVHHRFPAGIDGRCLVEIVAVGTAQIALRAHRLQHQAERRIPPAEAGSLGKRDGPVSAYSHITSPS